MEASTTTVFKLFELIVAHSDEQGIGNTLAKALKARIIERYVRCL